MHITTSTAAHRQIQGGGNRAMLHMETKKYARNMRAPNVSKSPGPQGSALDPTGGAYIAPQTP